MKAKYAVFYSWQSDLPKETNMIALRQALRESANQIENDIEDIRIEIDEATRDTAGSQNIIQMIFSKIDSCDMFVCDLTTINNKTDDSRKMPNPNVLIELGYAIATVGWERIILLFNKNHGSFPNDLPFDIDKHRATPYKVIDKKDNNGKKQIASTLKDAIMTIIEKEPLKPHELRELTPEKRKEVINKKNLDLVLSTIHIPTFDSFLEDYPQRFHKNIFFFKDYFISVVDSSTFFLYDDKLKELIMELRKNWITSLSFGQHFDADGKSSYLRYYIPMDNFPSAVSEKDFYSLLKLRDILGKNLRDLLYYVRHNYIDIDIDALSNKAYEFYEKEFAE